MPSLEKMTGIKRSEVDYYWPRPEALATEAGLDPNSWRDEKLDPDELFHEYARACMHVGKLPTSKELQIIQRELRTKTHTVYERYGGIVEFHLRFREWLNGAGPELQAILQFKGWRTSQELASDGQQIKVRTEEIPHHPGLRPFLPSSLQYLNVLARGEMPPYEAPAQM